MPLVRARKDVKLLLHNRYFQRKTYHVEKSIEQLVRRGLLNLPRRE